MFFTTVVKLVSETPEREALPGVLVALYDRDVVTPDDHLGSEVTDANGEARFRFFPEQYLDLDERIGGELPELYAVAYAPGGEVLASNRHAAISNRPRRHITLAVAAAAG
jgi:hypothetical protein